jgi:hypothetical protein
MQHCSFADLNIKGKKSCSISYLYEPNTQIREYGWLNDKFVSDIELYEKFKYIDGHSPFEWRQGVKHDAEKVMVLLKFRRLFIKWSSRICKF